MRRSPNNDRLHDRLVDLAARQSSPIAAWALRRRIAADPAVEREWAAIQALRCDLSYLVDSGRAESRVRPPAAPPRQPTSVLTLTVGHHAFSRIDFVIPTVLALLFFLAAFWRLGVPNAQIFDEVHHARSAMDLIVGKPMHDWGHPPLEEEIEALGIVAWHGEFDPSAGVWSPNETFSARSAIGWRFGSLLFGAFTLAATYALGRALFVNRMIATAAAALLGLDGVFFVQSRVAMSNVYELFFTVAGAAALAVYLREPTRIRWLLLTGVALGLACACRWAELLAWGIAVALLLAGRIGDHSVAGRVRPHGAGSLFACMVLTPLAIYAASYVPVVLRTGQSWAQVIDLQHSMYLYQASNHLTHPYVSDWWTWPAMRRPVWYYFHTAGPGPVSGIWCIGNGPLWWLSVPALVVALCVHNRRHVSSSHGRVGPLVQIAAFGLGQWPVWGAMPRSVDFMTDYLECIPFACLAIAYVGYRIWFSTSCGREWQRIHRGAVVAYAAAVILWAVFYYPLLSAYPVSGWFYSQHLLWRGNGWV
jgi:dolichyl-phosphate-mannose--protein O-mannosyl transferase